MIFKLKHIKYRIEIWSNHIIFQLLMVDKKWRTQSIETQCPHCKMTKVKYKKYSREYITSTGIRIHRDCSDPLIFTSDTKIIEGIIIPKCKYADCRRDMRPAAQVFKDRVEAGKAYDLINNALAEWDENWKGWKNENIHV